MYNACWKFFSYFSDDWFGSYGLNSDLSCCLLTTLIAPFWPGKEVGALFSTAVAKVFLCFFPSDCITLLPDWLLLFLLGFLIVTGVWQSLHPPNRRGTELASRKKISVKVVTKEMGGDRGNNNSIVEVKTKAPQICDSALPIEWESPYYQIAW